MSIIKLKEIGVENIKTPEGYVKHGRFVGRPILIVPPQRLKTLEDIAQLYPASEPRYGLWNGGAKSHNPDHVIVFVDGSRVATYYFLPEFGWCKSLTIRQGIILDYPAAQALLHIDSLEIPKLSIGRVFRLGPIIAALITGNDDPIIHQEFVRIMDELSRGNGVVEFDGDKIVLRL